MAAYFWNLRSSVPGPLQPDGESGREVLRTNAISTITPRGDVAAVPEAFRWRPIQGATHYRVQLMEVDGTPLWMSEVSDAEVPVRPEVAARIVPAKTLVWRVEAIDSRGAIVGRSDAQRFRLVVNSK